MKKTMRIKEIHVSTEGMILIDQLKYLIIEAIEDKSELSSKSFLTHSKSNTQMIDNMKMSKGYQAPKLQ